MLDDSRRPDPGTLGALPIFPLPNVVLLPGMMLPLNVFEPRYLALVDHVMSTSPYIGVPLMRPGEDPAAAFSARAPIFSTFGVGELVSHQALPDGRRLIRVEGIGRAVMRAELPLLEGFRRTVVELLDEPPPEDQHTFDIFKAQVERMAQVYPENDRELIGAVLGLDDPRVVSYALASLVPNVEALEGISGERLDGVSAQARLQQRCLETVSCDERVDLLLERLAILMDHLGGTRAAAESLN